jgi:hypothetical protein
MASDIRPVHAPLARDQSSQGLLKVAKDVFAGTCGARACFNLFEPSSCSEPEANLFAGGISVTLVGHPFDTIKVRLQSQSQANPLYCKLIAIFSKPLALLTDQCLLCVAGVVDCARKTVQWEGLGGLYKVCVQSSMHAACLCALCGYDVPHPCLCTRVCMCVSACLCRLYMRVCVCARSMGVHVHCACVCIVHACAVCMRVQYAWVCGVHGCAVCMRVRCACVCGVHACAVCMRVRCACVCVCSVHAYAYAVCMRMRMCM